MSKPRKHPPIPELSLEEAQQLIAIINRASKDFVGLLDELETAIGMLMLGRLVGWKVLLLIHNKRTIRKYEDILGIKIREFFPETGPLSQKSVAFNFIQEVGSFWKGVSGEAKIEKRRELT